MITISLCMIVKNEEAVLARCLNSVAAAVDEIIIVDTGSSDGTEAIAKTFTPHLYHFPWADDFSAARNFALDKASMEYLFWLDADDILEPFELEKLTALKAALDPATDVVTMKYHIGLDESGNPTFISTRGRLFKRSGGFRFMEPVHEHIPMRGAIYHSDLHVTHLRAGHHGERNLRIYEKCLERGESLSPRALYYYARELRDHGRYEEAAAMFESFLAGNNGWVEDHIAACIALAECYGKLNQKTKRTLALLESFRFDLPRPEACCLLGYDAMALYDYRRARFWFEQALIVPAADSIGFISLDYNGFIPHMELCVCCYHLHDLDAAIEHLNNAKAIKPDSPAVAHNVAFFGSL